MFLLVMIANFLVVGEHVLDLTLCQPLLLSFSSGQGGMVFSLPLRHTKANWCGADFTFPYNKHNIYVHWLNSITY